MPEETWEERRHVQYRRHFLVDNSVFHVERCMSVMQSGTQMIKLKRGTKGLVRLFYLDEHRTRLRWRPSRKSEKAKIPIDSIYKVTEGRQSELFHRQAEGSVDPSCCFTIYHGDHMESLDLITTNPEEARTWITGLKYLMAGISDEDSLAKRQRTHDQWVKQTFEEADKNGDGLLSIEEIHQLMRKLNVNLPRRKVRQMFQEADTDENQGTLTFEEFCVFYKMMSLRRDLYLLLLSYSDKKDHLTVDELAQFLKVEQKVNNVTADYCLDIIKKFEVSEENKAKNVLGIEGFTNFMRSPACDVFNPGHQEVCQDMDQPLCHYYIASSHNTYLTGDQLLSQSRVDMYARVLQEGCRCLEVDCWDGPEGEPVVHHGYTLTSKILFRDVVETINKHAFVKNEFPVILSIENHCSIQQQRKIAQYLKGILGDRLDLSCVDAGDGRQLPSPQSLKGKVLVKHFLTAVQWSKRFKDMGSVPICADAMQHLHEGKKLPYHLGEDAEEGEVSDEDSADEIEDECKFKLHCNNGTTEHQVESFIRKKLESLLKESQIRDKEDPDSFTVRALLKATHEGLNAHLGQSPDGKESGKKSQARALVTNFGKHKKATKPRSKMCGMEEEEDPQQNAGREGGQLSRLGRRRKTMKLCRELSDLVIYTNSVAAQDIVDDGTTGNVLSFSETRAHQVVQQKPEQVMAYNQRQLTRVYPSAYRIDSSNFNPLPYWNAGCQLVALNYQSEGRMMQLNRAKFKANGNCGYVLKPQQMCKGTFNPFSGDPLPANPKKQLILKVISGQQLPKPPDSMFGDRGEIIDPFVEVEIIGLPVDCCKDQTRVVDDNGFNPVWEETLTFTVHMPEIALVRFLVWDHDPIGRDFVGQRTVTFTSLVPGYRHVYLEGLTEASIFVHITINEIYGKWSPLILNPSYTILHILGASKSRQLQGLKGLFNKTPRHCSSENGSHCVRKRSIGDRILRRTASAPAKGRKKTKMGFQEVVEVKDSVSEATRDQGGVLRRTTRSLQARPVSMPVDRGLLGALVAPAVTGGKESSPAEDKDGRKTGQASRKGLPFPDFSKELSSPSSSTLHKDTSLGGTWGVSTTRAGAAAGQSAMPGPQRGSHQSQATSDACQESHRPIRSPGIPAHSLPDVQAKDAGRAEGSADSTLSPGGLEAGRAWARASLSLSDVSRLCSPTSDLHSTAILQDTDVSLLLDNITLTGDTEPGSSISTLIAHFEEHHTRADGPSPASQHGGSGVEAAPSFLSPRELPSPEITGTSHPPRSKPKPTDAPCAENWPRALSAPHGGPLQTPPRGRHWELLSSHNPATATDRTPGHILADPTLCTDSGGSSLVEVDGESGNVSLTICDDGGVCATPLACPLKRKYGRTVLEPCPRGWRNGYCKELLWSPISEILPNGQRAPGQGFQGAGSVHSHISALDRRGQQVSEPQQCTARAVLAPGPAPRLPSPLSSPCKSKSLGDLTSEDIACNFESKYECISRSFVPAGGLGRAGVAAGMPCLEPLDALTEQLRRLVSFDQEDSCEAQDSGHEASQLPRTLVRKLSSRSQSRVRNIASRAKEKQEASRQKGGEAGPGGGVVLRKRPPAPGLGVNRHSTGSYIAGYLRHSKGGALEGRGIPEGACAALHGSCVDQFRQDDSVLQTEPSPDDKPEIYFLLRL